MEITAQHIEQIPRGNLRVPRAEFAAVWIATERMLDNARAQNRADWYAAGVAITSRWIATSNYWSILKRWEPAYAPISTRHTTAHEELIEDECAVAEQWAARHPAGMNGRPGYLEAVLATLRWVWRGSGVPPIDVGHAELATG
jgi:hypothetical protein